MSSKTFTNDKPTPLTFEQWYNLNAKELMQRFTEAAANDEQRFDDEEIAMQAYEAYLLSFGEQTQPITLFDVSEYPEVYRSLSPDTVIEQFGKTLHHAIASSKDNTSALFGTIQLADGREARVAVNIEAAIIHAPEAINLNNLNSTNN